MFIETLHFDFDENIAGVSVIETEDIYLDIQADCMLCYRSKIICIRYPPLSSTLEERIYPSSIYVSSSFFFVSFLTVWVCLTLNSLFLSISATNAGTELFLCASSVSFFASAYF